MAKILIIDDEENIRNSLRSALERRGHHIVTACNFAEGKNFYKADFDLIFLDVMLPDGNGIDLLKDIRSQKKHQGVVMISGHADIEMAVDAIKAGAYDFIEKPLSLDRVLITIDNVIKANSLLSEKTRLEALVYGEFIGESSEIKDLKEAIRISAPKTSRFLILGENGTGKELAAHMIHNLSRNADGPFVAVNCAALPSELVESELFGHVKGAFTGANRDRKGRFIDAAGGSIFLDEISEMPLEAQAKILRAIETREITPVGSDKPSAINCNIIAASNKDLNRLVQDLKFREDLFYRLNVVQFKIPTLRDRKSDIPVLADYFLARFAGESGTVKKQLSDDALSWLMSYHFPGNVRELKNLIERVSIYCDSHIVKNEQLKPLMPFSPGKKPLALKEAVNQFELDYINAAITENKGNISKAARQLGIERSHLYKKLKKK